MASGDRPLPVAVDVMGGDLAPRAPLEGALQALGEVADLEVALVGSAALINPAVSALPARVRERIRVVAAEQVIAMDEAPVRAVRQKQDASLVRCIRLVKEQQACAAISAGHTGALMAAGLFLLDRLPGVDRPALSAVIPSFAGWGFLLLDAGANLSPLPQHLVQYAYLGAQFAQEAYGVPNPRVALLNIGEEAAKGPRLVREAYQVLRQSDLQFIGNIESRELLQGKADVVVTDGFTGNVALKLVEGVARDMMGEMRRILQRNWKTKLGGLLVRDALRAFRSRMNYQEHGGAPLLGLAGAVYKCHGSSGAGVFAAAIRQAFAYHRRGGMDRLTRRMRGLADTAPASATPPS